MAISHSNFTSEVQSLRSNTRKYYVCRAENAGCPESAEFVHLQLMFTP